MFTGPGPLKLQMMTRGFVQSPLDKLHQFPEYMEVIKEKRSSKRKRGDDQPPQPEPAPGSSKEPPQPPVEPAGKKTRTGARRGRRLLWLRGLRLLVQALCQLPSLTWLVLGKLKLSLTIWLI